MTKQLDQAALAQWKADVTPDDVCRLHTGAATGARTLWELTPSTTLDNHLSHADFAIAVRLRLGVDVAGDASCCRFCGSVADAGGKHALSCMSGGDAVTLHNQVRDLIHDYCRRAQLRPQLQAASLLSRCHLRFACWCGRNLCDS